MDKDYELLLRVIRFPFMSHTPGYVAQDVIRRLPGTAKTGPFQLGTRLHAIILSFSLHSKISEDNCLFQSCTICPWKKTWAWPHQFSWSLDLEFLDDIFRQPKGARTPKSYKQYPICEILILEAEIQILRTTLC